MSVSPGPMGPYGKEYAEAQRAFSSWVDKQASRVLSDIKKGLLKPEGGKGEVAGAKVEGVGVAAGVKVIGAEKTLIDLTKMAEDALLRRKGQHPEQLKLSLDRTRTTVGRNIRRIGDLSRRVGTTSTTARKAGTDAFKARDIALRAHALARTALNRQRTAAATARQAGRGARVPPRVDVSNINAAAAAIRRLERQVDQLVRAL
ncbi:hypothetical protein GCM10010252_28850 [Streptomyces aureoverticillatus]|nr:hypothetical protein GCM10010252_28850 [Streptomyces aureoverticillatus]